MTWSLNGALACQQGCRPFSSLNALSAELWDHLKCQNLLVGDASCDISFIRELAVQDLGHSNAILSGQ